jgi:hypothetical protein
VSTLAPRILAAIFMFNLGVKKSAMLVPRMVGRNRAERVVEIVKVMNETGFVAKTVPGSGIAARSA